MRVAVRSATAADRDWLASAYDADWEGPTMTLDGVDHPLLGQPTLVAVADTDPTGDPVGYLVHAARPHATEVLAMAAHPRGQGVGRILVEELLERTTGTVTLVTTNDNLDALGFYQRLGFRITAVRVGAVDRSRAVKPAIPRIGDHGIALHDELVLELRRS